MVLQGYFEFSFNPLYRDEKEHMYLRCCRDYTSVGEDFEIDSELKQITRG